MDALIAFFLFIHKTEPNEQNFRTVLNEFAKLLSAREKDLAELFDVSTPTMWRWMGGHSVPRQKMIVFYFNVMIDYTVAEMAKRAKYEIL